MLKINWYQESWNFTIDWYQTFYHCVTTLQNMCALPLLALVSDPSLWSCSCCSLWIILSRGLEPSAACWLTTWFSPEWRNKKQTQRHLNTLLVFSDSLQVYVCIHKWPIITLSNKNTERDQRDTVCLRFLPDDVSPIWGMSCSSLQFSLPGTSFW